ncbi:MAG: hypothetical protein AW09_004662 [Candidatus Accumulibacter phosphatis]|uniref:Uncharacterized protein n=1 Tax=Candidatus Accumulibacter phosphatis TaxID=327160 RepID=A0A084Y6B5_9PROT|nr:MAG: hypothetical protein AW09_004662 [Candidatus Accumulibacter phosphatis]
MAHGGQELALGAVGGLGSLLGQGKRERAFGNDLFKMAAVAAQFRIGLVEFGGLLLQDCFHLTAPGNLLGKRLVALLQRSQVTTRCRVLVLQLQCSSSHPAKAESSQQQCSRADAQNIEVSRRGHCAVDLGFRAEREHRQGGTHDGGAQGQEIAERFAPRDFRGGNQAVLRQTGKGAPKCRGPCRRLSGGGDVRPLRRQQKLLIPLARIIIVTATDQQPRQQTQVADGHDRAAEDPFMDHWRTGDEQAVAGVHQQLWAFLGNRRYCGARLLLAGFGKDCPILATKDDTRIDRLSAQGFLFDLSAEALLDGIKACVQAVLRGHVERLIDQIGVDFVAASQFENGLPPLGDKVCKRGCSALAVRHQAGRRGGSQLRLRGIQAPQQNRHECSKAYGHDPWPVQDEAAVKGHRQAFPCFRAKNSGK